ncbi:MAG: hypothetical protein JJ896_07865 [Rhodothermales bacterium]|nr:hypothetical protein [Rhodothermales bacterium]MBO6779556.1 hypothetical protein [Rhodothermales bacterium]
MPPGADHQSHAWQRPSADRPTDHQDRRLAPYRGPAADPRAGARPVRDTTWAETLYPTRIPEPQPGLLDVWKAIRRSRWHGIALAVSVWALVAVFLVVVPPRYKSSTVLLIDTGALAAIAETYAATDDAVSPFGLPKLANQAVILETSVQIADSATARLLRAVPVARLEELGLPVERAEIAEWLAEGAITIVAGDGKESADVIEVVASAPDATLAAQVSNLYAESYLSMIAQAVAGQREAALVQQRENVANASAEVASLDQQLGQFLRENGSLSIEQEAALAAGRLSELRGSLDDARIELSTHTARLSSLEGELDGLDFDRLAERIASSAEEEIAATHRQLAQIEISLEQFYAKNPELRQDPSGSRQVTELVNDARVLRDKLDLLSERYVQEIVATGGIDLAGDSEGRTYILNLRRQIAEERVAVRAAEARVRAIQGRISAYENSQTRYSDQSVTLAQLTRNKQAAETRLTSEIDRLATLQSDQTADYARRIAAAEVPEDAAFPNTAVIAVIGLMLGLLAGGGGAFARTRLLGRVYEAADLKPAGVMLGGMLPDLSRAAKRAAGADGKVWVGSRGMDATVVLASAPNSAEAAMVRKYALGLSSRTPGGGTIVFTSADSGVGKSLTVANVGCALALAGYQTLIVDADPYRQGLTRASGLSAACRLDAISGLFPDQGGLDRFPGALQLLFGLQLTARESANLEPALIARLVDAVSHYRQHFDFVLVDTPPVAASAIAAGLAPFAQRTVGVVGSGKTRRELLTMAVGELRTQGVELSELLLNRVRGHEDEAFGFAYSEAHRYYNGGPT